MLKVLTFAACLMLLGVTTSQEPEPETGNHPDWPRWCGKVYKSGFPSFDPGGQTVIPPVAEGAPLLHVQFKPRYSLYVDTETVGEIVVNAELSDYYGERLPDVHNGSRYLDFVIRLGETHLTCGSVPINSTGNTFSFPLTGITPSKLPYNLTLLAKISGSSSDVANITAWTELFYLPNKPAGGGSITRLDNLSGGVYFKNAASGNKFVPFFAYGLYAIYEGFLNDTPRIDNYAGKGLTAMTPLMQYPESADAFAYLDQINLRYQYNLRERYKNLTWVEENVIAARNNEAIFSYWSTDEPDGHQDPFSAPVAAYDLIRRLDPYHPVALVLNCQDYYFGPYSAPCDIITTDPYPIGINSTFSKWGTACNTTLGDCGCDNCIGGSHAILDVRDRFDTFAQYERYLGRWPKPKVHVLQSFHGEDYWSRDPTPEETWAMALVGVNHGARGFSAWVYPTSEVLMEAHGSLARVLSMGPVVDLLMGVEGRRAQVEVGAENELDVVYWAKEADMVVFVVNPTYDAVTGEVEVSLPGAQAVERILWGNISWTLTGSTLKASGVPALGTSIVLLRAAPETN